MTYIVLVQTTRGRARTVHTRGRRRGRGTRAAHQPSERLQVNVHAHWGKQSAQFGRAQHPWSVGCRAGREAAERAISQTSMSFQAAWSSGDSMCLPERRAPSPPNCSRCHLLRLARVCVWSTSPGHSGSSSWCSEREKRQITCTVERAAREGRIIVCWCGPRAGAGCASARCVEGTHH